MLAAGLTAAQLSSAQPENPTDAQVSVTGSAEVSIPPTDAAVSVEIKTSASTAVAASADNARLSKKVKDALQAAGLRAGEIAESRLSVGPQWVYDESTRSQKRTGFDATNSIELKTAQLDKLSVYIDSALSAGATGISDITFSAKEVGAARRQALSDAVADARQDADAMARAAGGKLGDLLSLSTEEPNRFAAPRLEQVTLSKARSETGTEVSAPQIKVSVTVFARWKFVRVAGR